jgi:ribonuclease E
MESITTAITPEARVVAQEILKSDTEESFSVVESPAPFDAAAPVAQAASEAPAPAAPVSPAPVAPAIVVEPAKPAPVRPTAGNTGSLFFTADADTPSSVTRHLFEPMPAAQPAAVTEKDDGYDLPVVADNDEADREEKNQDSERSA